MAEPPLVDGSVQVTVVWGLEPLAIPATLTAVTPVGAVGTVAGVTLAEAAEAVLVPAALVAVTVNVYAVPLARPLNTQLVELPVSEVEHAAGVVTAGLDVTV
jgi:hypothetical protein